MTTREIQFFPFPNMGWIDGFKKNKRQKTKHSERKWKIRTMWKRRKIMNLMWRDSGKDEAKVPSHCSSRRLSTQKKKMWPHISLSCNIGTDSEGTMP